MVRTDVQHFGKERCYLSGESVITAVHFISEYCCFDVSNRFIVFPPEPEPAPVFKFQKQEIFTFSGHKSDRFSHTGFQF